VNRCASGVEIATAAEPVAGVVIDSTSAVPGCTDVQKFLCLSSSAIIFPLLVEPSAEPATAIGAKCDIIDSMRSIRCSSVNVLRGGPARTSPAPCRDEAQHLPFFTVARGSGSLES